MLNENSKFLPAKVVSEHINKLNTFGKGYLSGEWEVVIINALSKIGSVKYEENLGGDRKPDVYFESKKIKSFLADITVVSDEGYHDANPVNYFHEEVSRYIKKNNIQASQANRIHIEFGSKTEGKYGDQKVKLNLPSKREIPQFVKDNFKEFVGFIKTKPAEKRGIEIPVGDFHIKVSYDPNQKYSSAAYTAYNVPYSLERNPIYKSLKDKADQLKKSGCSGIRGVILCDGDCNALETEMKGFNEYAIKSIVENVFRKHSTLSFILTLAIKENRPLFSIIPKRHIEIKSYINRNAEYPVDQTYIGELERIVNILPVPEKTPVNALYEIKFKQKFKGDQEFRKFEGNSFLGGGSMSSNEIKISSRMLTEILAGLTDYKELEKRGVFGHRKDNWIKNFFLRQRMEGRIIEEISAEKCSTKDDDWIVIKFGQVDPAISKFDLTPFIVPL